MARVKSKKAEVGIDGDMTPLIDCIFLLLIFLMCVTEITKTENDQNLVLPYAKNATEDKNPEDRIVLNVWPVGNIAAKTYMNGSQTQGFITVSGEVLDWGGLSNLLEKRAIHAPKEPGPGGSDIINLPVKIRGHRTTPFKLIQFTMIYCIDMRYWKISFGTFNATDFKSPSVLFGDTATNLDIWSPSEINKMFK